MNDNMNNIICSSSNYISLARAKQVFFEDEEDKSEINEYQEFRYIETGEESKISIKAAQSKPYTDFFEEFIPNNVSEEKRVHKYTVSLHRAICTEENLLMFKKFDKVQFGKDRTKSSYDGFLTNSPLYDPKDPNFENKRPYKDLKRIDGDRIFKDEGVYPEYYGTYHLCHRIDDKLIAINVWDITEKTLGSIYTFYDPEYSFLSLGHVTAVREMEYMRKIRARYNPSMRYYYMGYYVINCKKSIYKEHMHPQKLLCPISYQYTLLTEELKKKIAEKKYFKLIEDAPDWDD